MEVECYYTLSSTVKCKKKLANAICYSATHGKNIESDIIPQWNIQYFEHAEKSKNGIVLNESGDEVAEEQQFIDNYMKNVCLSLLALFPESKTKVQLINDNKKLKKIEFILGLKKGALTP